MVKRKIVAKEPQVKFYKVILPIYERETNRNISVGEVIQLSSDKADILLVVGAVAEMNQEAVSEDNQDGNIELYQGTFQSGVSSQVTPEESSGESLSE